MIPESAMPGENRKKTKKPNSILIRMPQIIVLLGQFEEREIRILEETLGERFPFREAISWVSFGENALSSPCSYRNQPPVRETSDAKKRQAYSRCVQEEDELLFLKSTVASVFNSTASRNFQEPGVQMAVLVKTDQPESGMLPSLLPLLRELLGEQFPRVHADAYLLVDQSACGERKKEREASIYQTLLECEELLQNTELNMAYVLSNVTNQEMLLRLEDAQTEQYASIALAIAMKDLISENASFCYSDREFRQGMANFSEMTRQETGRLSSLGYLHLSKNETFAALVVYRTVWEALRSSDAGGDPEELQQEAGLKGEQIRQYFEMAKPSLSFSTEIFDAIVWDHAKEEQSVFTMTCADAVRQYFGRNLDLYLELNAGDADLAQKLDDWQSALKRKLQQISDRVGSFPLVRLLEAGEREAEELIAEAEEQIETQKIGLSQWGSKVFAQEYGRLPGEVSPLYVLAQNYLKYKSSLEAGERQKKIAGRILERLHEFGTYYRAYETLIGEETDRLEEEMDRQKVLLGQKKGIGAVQITNAESYYAGLVLDLIEKEQRRPFRKLVNDLGERLVNGELTEETAGALVKEYCESCLLSHPLFHQDFLDELQNRLIGYEGEGYHIQTGTDVSNFLLTQINQAQHYLFYDRIQEGDQAYEAMTLFVQRDSIFLQGKDRNALVANKMKDQKMKLFCDSTRESLDVLFLAGNLRSRSLYKWNLYEEACGQTEEERDG